MPRTVPTIYVIGGCNGAGKTTFAKEFLPKEVKCLRFLNADEIARGISPLVPEAGAIKAARFLLKEFSDAIAGRETLAIESTLSGKTNIRLLGAAADNDALNASLSNFLYSYLPLAARWAVWD